MYLLGLTGGIGSGKTLVCSILEKLGVEVYYADSEAKRLMNTDPDLVIQIKKLFGMEAYNGTSLNREFLAKEVFGDPAKLALLNAAVHPVVRKDFSHWAQTQKDAPYIVEETAILFESGVRQFLDGSVLVYAPEGLRLQRVMDRDGLNEEEVRSRMKNQMDEEEKKRLADHVIINDEKEMLLPQVIELHKKILNSR